MIYFIRDGDFSSAVSEPQGEFQTPITEENLAIERAKLAPPKVPTAQDLADFLKYCFAGVDAELSAVWSRIDSYRNESTVAARKLTTAVADLTAATNPSLFVTANPPQSGSWGLALARIQDALSNTASKITAQESKKVNDALVLFNLPKILTEE